MPIAGVDTISPILPGNWLAITHVLLTDHRVDVVPIIGIENTKKISILPT